MPADPFADLKQAFEPPREKLKTFNLKQVVTRSGTVLMNMLERLLENTDVDARDVETDQTLLEYACQTGNLGLAKLCYRRGANLSAKTSKGDTPFNIVTRNKRYDLMEFLHTYGVKINSRDHEGKTALHSAVVNDDVDAICRLLEWGADVNVRDNRRRTPIHLAAAAGQAKATMLLLEMGADMNAKDDREYTAVAHAESQNHFALMDRLVQLGGKGHGLHQKSGSMGHSRSAGKLMGQLTVSSGMLKSSSLGRIGKIAVDGMGGPIVPKGTK
jgi:ankyrin repeat protein